jgi:hypothetical protein
MRKVRFLALPLVEIASSPVIALVAIAGSKHNLKRTTMIKSLTDYGPCKKGQDYRVLTDGFDWYLIACGGKAVYVPRWVFEKD